MKRKRSDVDDEYILRKIRKLERKFRRGRRSKRQNSQSNSDSTPPRDSSRSKSNPKDIETSDTINLIEDWDPTEHSIANPTCVEPVPSTSATPTHVEPGPSTSAASVPTLSATEELASFTVEPASIEQTLDELALQILGEDPTNVTLYGKEIQKDLAVRFEHTATNGLTKELRKELKEKYLTPSNCILIEPPVLNEEIKAALTDVVVKRDKAIEIKQRQLTTAISCLGEAITLLLPKQDKDQTILKLLMDASRILCDCQHADSITRKNFILFQLKKDMKAQLEKTKIDKFLFGENLNDTIKSAKAIQKSSTDLRPAVIPKSTASKTAPPPPPTRQQNLNYRAPPTHRRPLGGQRTKEPAAAAPPRQARYRPPMTSSRPSQRHPNHNRR